MNKQAAEEFTQTIEQHVGVWWRQIKWAKDQGIPDLLGLSMDEWVRRIGGYVKLEIEERRQAVKELTDEGMSTREIGEVLGVDQSTVVRDANASKEQQRPGNGGNGDANASKPPKKTKQQLAAERKAQQKQERERLEESKRETLIRITDAAYNGTLSLANKTCRESILKRLSDKAFRAHLASRVRFDSKAVNKLNRGIAALVTIIQATRKDAS